MSSPTSATQALTSPQILDREFLEMRAKLLELAASFDRLDRGEGDVTADPRLLKLLQAVDLVRRENVADRAEQLQLLFSRPYEEKWAQKFGISSS